MDDSRIDPHIVARCLGACQGELRERLDYGAKLQGVKGAMRLALRVKCSRSGYEQPVPTNIARLLDFARLRLLGTLDLTEALSASSAFESEADAARVVRTLAHDTVRIMYKAIPLRGGADTCRQKMLPSKSQGLPNAK